MSNKRRFSSSLFLIIILFLASCADNLESGPITGEKQLLEQRLAYNALSKMAKTQSTYICRNQKETLIMVYGKPMEIAMMGRILSILYEDGYLISVPSIYSLPIAFQLGKTFLWVNPTSSYSTQNKILYETLGGLPDICSHKASFFSWATKINDDLNDTEIREYIAPWRLKP